MLKNTGVKKKNSGKNLLQNSPTAAVKGLFMYITEVQIHVDKGTPTATSGKFFSVSSLVQNSLTSAARKGKKLVNYYVSKRTNKT